METPRGDRRGLRVAPRASGGARTGRGGVYVSVYGTRRPDMSRQCQKSPCYRAAVLLLWTLLLATACTGSGPGSGPVLTGQTEEGRAKAATPAGTPCTDADGDGFADAWTCPGLPPEMADCADQDPAVGPDTERCAGGPLSHGRPTG